MELEKLEQELYKKEESEELRRRRMPKEEPPVRPLDGTRRWRHEDHGIGERLKIEYVGPPAKTWRNWILGGAFFALLFLSSVSAYFIYQALTIKDINLTVIAPDNILLGKPFELKVNFANQSDRVLREAKLSLTLPDGVSFLGAPASQRNESKDVGDIGIGTMSTETFSLIVTNDPQSVKTIQVALSYASMGRRSRFERNEEVRIAVGEPAVQIDLRAPEKVFSGEEFETVLSYRNISDVDFSNVELRADFPPTFVVQSSSIKPDAGNAIWQIGSLSAGSRGEIVVKGNIVGPEKSFFEIKTSLRASFLGTTYVIDTKAASFSIAPSPLSLIILANDKSDYISHPGDSIRYEIRYTNNTDVGLRDVILKVKLLGEMFDFATIQGERIFFNSISNTLTWNAANNPQFAVLEPGGSGAVSFYVQLKPNYPIRYMNDKNFLLKLEAEIESPTVPAFINAERTVGISSFVSKVAGKATIDTRVLFRDAASGIVNKGPFPPVVNQPTNYTVHWIITNYATDIENVTVRAFLLSGVRWTGKVKSNISEVPTFNERTQEVSWTISRIPATRGVLGNPIEAVFQIEATPSINQVGNSMPLISETELRAHDTFVDEEIVSTDYSVSTSLPDDPTISVGSGGIVRQ